MFLENEVGRWKQLTPKKHDAIPITRDKNFQAEPKYSRITCARNPSPRRANVTALVSLMFAFSRRRAILEMTGVFPFPAAWAGVGRNRHKYLIDISLVAPRRGAHVVISKLTSL